MAAALARKEASPVQSSLVQCSPVQCSTVEASTVQSSAVQYSAMQHSAVQNGENPTGRHHMLISTNAGAASLVAGEAVSRETCGTRWPLLWSVCTDWGLWLGPGLGLEYAQAVGTQHGATAAMQDAAMCLRMQCGAQRWASTSRHNRRDRHKDPERQIRKPPLRRAICTEWAGAGGWGWGWGWG